MRLTEVIDKLQEVAHEGYAMKDVELLVTGLKIKPDNLVVVPHKGKVTVVFTYEDLDNGNKNR